MDFSKSDVRLLCDALRHIRKVVYDPLDPEAMQAVNSLDKLTRDIYNHTKNQISIGEIDNCIIAIDSFIDDHPDSAPSYDPLRKKLLSSRFLLDK